jgi:hypothetical protein
MTVFGMAGWYVGERFGMLSAFLLSGFASMFGVYVGWRINREYFS